MNSLHLFRKLWAEAVALARKYRVHPVSKNVAVSYTRLKKLVDEERPIRVLPRFVEVSPARSGNVFTYDETGRVYCSCPSDQRDKIETRELAFAGFEKSHDTLKFRCPTAAYGFNCSGREECESLAPGGIGGFGGFSEFGRIVRVPLDIKHRIFTPVARQILKWEKAYKKRSSAERVNSRIDQVVGFERHTTRGKQKMELRISLALIALLTMALGCIQIGQSDR